MKKTLLTLGLVAISTAVFAQGKVGMQNSVSSIIQLTSDTSKIVAGDAGLAGQAIGNSTVLPSGKKLVAGLYAGTSSTSLSLYSPRAASATTGDARGYVMTLTANAAGLIPLTQYQLASPLILGGTASFLQIKVWDTQYATYELALGQLGAYTGSTAVFPFTPGGSTTYPSTATAILPNSPIVVSATVPEPASAAIVGMGLASLLIFRRRK